MSKKIDIQEALKRNLLVDPKVLAEVLRVVQELKASGVTGGEGYNLVSPFSTHTFGHGLEEAVRDEKNTQVHRCR